MIVECWTLTGGQNNIGQEDSRILGRMIEEYVTGRLERKAGKYTVEGREKFLTINFIFAVFFPVF